MNKIVLLLSSVSRFACVGFVVMAGMAIPEAWNLIDETTYTKEGNMVYVPIETCKPLSISLDNGNTTITFPALTGPSDNCHTLRYFINACVASMFFAGLAIAVFLLFDMSSRFCKKAVSRSSVVGMSLFLAFILVQTAACCYALYKECNYWIVFYEERFQSLEQDDVNEVRTYANKFFFFLTSIIAIGCAGLLVVDSVVAFCVGDPPNRSSKQQPEPNIAPAQTTPVAEPNDIENDAAPNDFQEQATTTDPKSWTNY
jgi:hypothetical protein